MNIWRKILGCTTAGMFAFAFMAAPAPAVETSDPIKISLMDSNDGDIVNYLYGGVLKAAGYNVEFVRVDYTAMVAAVETGDLDVAAALWDTTGWGNFIDSVKSGNVVNYGPAGIEIVEGWWYPAYVKEQCPGLPSWEGLKDPDCVKALSTVETEPRGRLVDAPADWETDSQKRLDGLGLEIEAISSGSPITMVATIKAAVDKKEPIIGWGFIPHWFFESVDGEFITYPEHDEACYDDPAWGPNPDATWDCGYTPGYIWKLASKKFTDKTPEAARLLHLFRMSSEDVSTMLGDIEVDGQDIEDVVQKWLDDNKATWSAWLR